VTKALKETCSWSSYVVGTLGCHFQAASPSTAREADDAVDLVALPHCHSGCRRCSVSAKTLKAPR